MVSFAGLPPSQTSRAFHLVGLIDTTASHSVNPVVHASEAWQVFHAVIDSRVVANAKTRAIAGPRSELLRAAAYRTELRRFLARTDAVAARAGLTSQRYDLLLMVSAAGEVRLTELCELLQVQQTAVTELVKRSEEAGLIERRVSPDDGRVWLLRVTRDGERRLMRALAELRDDRDALAAVFREVDRRFRAASA